jgi:nucleoside diphosphate kinase
VQIKPDGVQRNIVGEVIKRFEQKGFRLVALKMTQVTVSCPQPAAWRWHLHQQLRSHLH